MQRPKISIIIPCYNHGQYIEEAIKSIEDYKGTDYEIVIVNDGSTDDYTNRKLTELKESGYHVIFQENQGLAKTRNNGIREAKGEYILPLDADNKITPALIEKSISILDRQPEISIVYSDRKEFEGRNKIIHLREFDFSKMLRENYIDACAVFRKSVWHTLGGFDENMPLQGYEDWDFWLRAGKSGMKFYYINEPLFHYRVLESSMLHQLHKDSKRKTLLEYIYNKHCSVVISEFIRNAAIENRMERMNEHPLRTSAYYLTRWLTGKKARMH